MIEIGHVSHPGKSRALNEDSYDIDLPAGIALLVDGMGGQNAGDVVSAQVRDELRTHLLRGEAPASALALAGDTLRQQRQQQTGKPSGAGAVVAVLHDARLELAWIGACHAWFFDGDETRPAGMPTSGAEANPANTGTSVQALGLTSPDKLNIRHAVLPWRRGHAVLLCSDGLHDDCPAQAIQALLADTRRSAQECADSLTLLALRGQAANNLSAIVLRKA